jgi:hypothetical protein
VALPGGRVDPGETVIDAALRRGRRGRHQTVRLTVLGLLDDHPTRSIRHHAGRDLGRRPADPRPAPDEVVAVYRVDYTNYSDDSLRFITIPESSRPVVQIPLGNDLIHAPTGAVLLQLRWLCLEGRHEPVDDLEQPVFAWK